MKVHNIQKSTKTENSKESRYRDECDEKYVSTCLVFIIKCMKEIICHSLTNDFFHNFLLLDWESKCPSFCPTKMACFDVFPNISTSPVSQDKTQ